MVGEITDDRNRAAGADEDGVAPHQFLERLGCELNGRMLGVDHQAGPPLSTRTSVRMPLGVFLRDELLERCDDFVGILIRHQPDAHLRGGLGRDHGLRARAGEAAGDAVDFERGPRPDALQNRYDPARP